MITTIIITVCSTLVMVGLITSIAVLYYKLSKRLTKEKLYKELDSMHSRMDSIYAGVRVNADEFQKDIFQEFHRRDEEIHHLRKMVDSRADKTNVRIDKLIKALEENGNTLKVTDVNI